MELHRDNKKYIEWNTEATAAILFKRFPQSLIFVIKPTRMHLRTFADYSTFIETNDFGNPTHSSDFGAVKHLNCLYSSALTEMSKSVGDNLLCEKPLYLVGFSKGCVVLNQMVYELPIAHKEPELQIFLKKIHSFYWLDGGHSGGAEKTWVTDESSLKYLSQLGCEIEIHVTPYQMQDPMRKWVGEQESKFFKRLKRMNAKVKQIEHFESLPPCLENHFQVLKEF